MRKFLLPIVCLSSLMLARPAEAGWWDWVSPSKNWQRVKDCCSASSRRVTVYCREKVDRAKADQAKMWGLKLPEDLTARRPLVICVHGLDSTSGVFGAMTVLLREQGYQVGYFNYASDAPIRQSAERLADEMGALHKAYPGGTGSDIPATHRRIA